MEAKIINSGARTFPYYVIVVDGIDFCSTNNKYNAELIVKLLKTVE